MASLHNIVLFGFMGAGKTVVAKRIAKKAGLTLVDTDDVITELAGKSIPEIFAAEGEEKFRSYERQAVAQVAQQKEAVIATGGGVILRECNVEVLSTNGFLVFLRASCQTLLARVQNCTTVRPLAKNEEQFKRLYQSRAKLYAQIPHIVDTDILSVEDISSQIITLYRRAGGIAPHCPSW